MNNSELKEFLIGAVTFVVVFLFCLILAGLITESF